MRVRLALILSGIALVAVVTIVVAACNKPGEGTQGMLSNPVARVTIDDSVITGAVKLALLEDPATRSLGFNVETRRGKVRLNGFVDNQIQIDRMMTVARGVAGVKGIKMVIGPKGRSATSGDHGDDGIGMTASNVGPIGNLNARGLDAAAMQKK
jgi:hypothetical protein